MLNPRSNRLLDQLTESEGLAVFQHLHLVSLTEGQSIYAPGDLIDQIYFPVTALIAIARVMKDGGSIDVAWVGKEGAIGFRGMVSRCPNRVFVSASGLAYQISLQQLQQIQDYQLHTQEPGQLAESGAWLTRMYVQSSSSVFDDIALETACAHFHSTRHRVARWLLNRYRHSQSLYIAATHQKIADSLGIRRESVTHALLQLKGIQYSRNHIEILDFARLEGQACECHRIQSDAHSHQLSLAFETHF